MLIVQLANFQEMIRANKIGWRRYWYRENVSLKQKYSGEYYNSKVTIDDNNNE